MKLDALAFEPQFLEHLAPVWAALPAEMRGTFTVAPELALRAKALGIPSVVKDPRPIRRSGPPPKAKSGAGPVAIAASIGDIKIGRRLGYRQFVRFEHGAGQSYGGDPRTERHASYAGGVDAEDVGLFLMPNGHSAGRWKRRYPAAAVRVVGCPKLDRMPERGRGPITVAITFHWPLPTVPETFPAFGDFKPALAELARHHAVIGHGHPRWDQYGERLQDAYETAGIEYVRDFDDVCRRADLLVFDNTSAGFEFAATGRPVVVMNARGYRKKVDHGLRFWTAASVGVQVDAVRDERQNTALLLRAVETALEDSHAEQREVALSEVYAYRNGAAERAANEIAEWASTRAEQAA